MTYPVAIIILLIQPSEYWDMTPEEFRWLYNFKFPDKSQHKKQDVARWKRLFELPEARPSVATKDN